MVADIDANEIKQITENIYKKRAEIYIPCIKTYGDILGVENEFTPSAEIFFEFAAHHKSLGEELKQRENPVRVFRTSPIVEDLLDIANKEWEENKSDRIQSKIELVFSATDPQIFDSVMSSNLSIFEEAIILKEECKDSANIIIISNNPDIMEIKGRAEKESGKKLSEKDFKIMNTDDWLKWKIEQNDDVVKSILLNSLLIKGEMVIGGIKFKLVK